jgi:DNA replication protein DnaC
MIDYGLRRSFFNREICTGCGEMIKKKYMLHPFPLPPPYEKGHWLTSDCSCIKKELSQERLNRNMILITRNVNPLPPGLRQHTFETFKVSGFNRTGFDACCTFVRNFGKVEGGQGLLLLGSSGTGKTHLAAAIANSLKDHYSVVFAHMPTLLDRMRTTTVPLEPLLSADLLVLDDIGSERETGWTMERLLIIVDGRLTNLKPTVFTTNYDIVDLEKRVGMRVASRILGHNVQLLLEGPDWRLTRLNN